MGYACHTRYSGWCEQAVKKVILWGKIRFFNRNVGFLKFCRKKMLKKILQILYFCLHKWNYQNCVISFRNNPRDYTNSGMLWFDKGR